jgi:cell division transport system permease protein
MKLLKTILNFAIPLTIMLSIFSTYLIVNKVVMNYKQSISDDYTIIITSEHPMENIKSIAGIKVTNFQKLDQNKILADIKDTVSVSTLTLLNKNMPHFYKIYLEEFPTKSKLTQIKKELSKNKDIQSVEMFADDHNHIYSFLILIQDLAFVLFFVVLAFSILLVIRQIKIWFFEHNRRIRIMELHGGSILYSSKPILTVVGISAIISLVLTVLIILVSISNASLLVQSEILEFLPKPYQLNFELMMIAVLSFAIPIVTYLGLLIKYKLK